MQQSRTTAPEAMGENNLEDRFWYDTFLRIVAVNTVIQIGILWKNDSQLFPYTTTRVYGKIIMDPWG